MKHLKTFEQYSQEYNSGAVEEGFFSKKTPEQKLEKAPDAFKAKLKEMEDMAAKGGEKVVFDKNSLINKAYDNSFRGELKSIPSRGDGKIHVLYKDGLSTIQKIAAGSGAMTVGESVETEEANEGIMDFVSGVKKYKLATTFPSPKAAEIYTKRKDLVGQLRNSILKSKMGLTPEQAEKATIAIFNFANGAVPVPAKWNIDYNAETDELTVNPNGKGLFQGDPMAFS